MRPTSSHDWVEIYNLWSNLRVSAVWKTVQIYLSPLLVQRGWTFTENFQIRFGQEDDQPTLTVNGVDGYSFDDIGLMDIDGNAVDVGVGAIIFPLLAQPTTLSYENVTITVNNWGLTNATRVPVYYTLNGGNAIGPIYVDLAANSSKTVTFPQQVDLRQPGTYVVEAWTFFTGDMDPSNDRMRKTIERNGANDRSLVLPFLEDFEGMTTRQFVGLNVSGLQGLSYCSLHMNDGVYARLRTQQFYYGGTHGLTFDRSAYSPDSSVQVNLTCTFNLNSYSIDLDNLRLSFAYVSSGDSADSNNRVWIRTSSSQPWIQAYDLDQGKGTIGAWSVIDFSLTAILMNQRPQQQFGQTFQIRFGYGGNDVAGPSLWEKSGSSIDNLKIYKAPRNDLSIVDFTSPTNVRLPTGWVSNSIPVTLTLKNEGLTVPTTAEVYYRVSSPFLTPVVSERINFANQPVQFTPGSTMTYTFQTPFADASRMGPNANFTFEIGISSDENPANNVISRNLRAVPSTTPRLPWVQDFERCTNDTNTTYHWGTRSHIGFSCANEMDFSSDSPHGRLRLSGFARSGTHAVTCKLFFLKKKIQF